LLTSYAGILEQGSKEYTLDDFHCIQLDKMDRFVCLRESQIEIPREGEDEESSSDDDDDDDSCSDESEVSESDEEDIEDEISEIAGDLENGPEVVEDTQREDLKAEKKKARVSISFTRIVNSNSCHWLQKDENRRTAVPEPTPNPPTTVLEAGSAATQKPPENAPPEDLRATPLPGETLAVYYARSSESPFYNAGN
jgi:hypothetical protein